METEYSKYLIDTSTPLVDALKILNETGKRIVFLVEEGRLAGSLTYGDVSRWIIKGLSLNDPSYEAATKSPVFVYEDGISEADYIFSEKDINALPVVDRNNAIVDILFKDRQTVQLEQIDLPVVIMAGGKGTRLHPYTKILPKPLIPIGEIPISEHIMNRFAANGCQDFYLVVNYKKNMVKAYYNERKNPFDVHFIDEEIPLGTGGGLSLMKGMIKSTFILTNCDSFLEEDYAKVLKMHKERKNMVTMICANQRYEIPYGVVETDTDGALVSMREKPNFRYLTNTGTYIVEPEVIDMIKKGEAIGFPDVIEKVKNSGFSVGIYTVKCNAWLDMGQFDTMDQMKKRLKIFD